MSREVNSRPGIYKIESTASGRVYVGSAANIHRRWLQHRTRLSRHVHHSIKLQRAWLKYGPEGFRFEVLEFVGEESRLIEREQYWMDALFAPTHGYNICAEAGRSTGQTWSDERKKAHSLRMSGQKRTDEQKAATSARMMGHRHSADTVGKIRARAIERGLTEAQLAGIKRANTGRTWTPEFREKMMAARKPWSDEQRADASERAASRRHTPEAKAKIAENNRVRMLSPETLERMAAAQRGKSPSTETRAKLAKAGKGRVVSPETRARLVAAQLLRRANERTAMELQKERAG